MRGRRQFTIGRLMVLVAGAGVVCAALARPCVAWGMVLSGLFLILLLTSLLGILYRRGPRRGFWVGFALFGVTFLVPFAFVDDVPDSLGKVFLTALFEAIGLLTLPGMRDKTLADLAALGEVNDDARIAVAASALGLLFAGLGGLIGRRFATPPPPETGPPAARPGRAEDGPGKEL